jgi:hypothetical protein
MMSKREWPECAEKWRDLYREKCALYATELDALERERDLLRAGLPIVRAAIEHDKCNSFRNWQAARAALNAAPAALLALARGESSCADNCKADPAEVPATELGRWRQWGTCTKCCQWRYRLATSETFNEPLVCGLCAESTKQDTCPACAEPLSDGRCPACSGQRLATTAPLDPRSKAAGLSKSGGEPEIAQQCEVCRFWRRTEVHGTCDHAMHQKRMMAPWWGAHCPDYQPRNDGAGGE